MANQPEEHFFRDICLHTGVALIAADCDLRIRFWNVAATRLFGGSGDAMIGQPIMSVVPFERREIAQRLLERSLHKGEVSEFEFAHRSPTGDPVYLAVNISPIVEEGGRCAGVSVYVRDVSRRMQLEREMAETRKMSALGAMAGEVAHHFNNVIGGIITSIDFVQDSNDTMAMRRVLKATSSALGRASQLTKCLLAFAEGDHTQGPTGPVTQIVEQFVRGIEAHLSGGNIRIETDLQPVSAVAPIGRITTILERLTENAREAMPGGGTLRIELSRGADGGIILRLLDTGTGIRATDLSRVFEPFFTTKTTVTNGGEHAGLGLAVVHGIVRELSGAVALAARKGGGTVCTVTLPDQPSPDTYRPAPIGQ